MEWAMLKSLQKYIFNIKELFHRQKINEHWMTAKVKRNWFTKMPAEAEPSVQKDESIVNIPTSHDISCDEILVNNCDFLI